jgi:hypothetical protein
VEIRAITHILYEMNKTYRRSRRMNGNNSGGGSGELRSALHFS